MKSFMSTYDCGGERLPGLHFADISGGPCQRVKLTHTPVEGRMSTVFMDTLMDIDNESLRLILELQKSSLGLVLN